MKTQILLIGICFIVQLCNAQLQSIGIGVGTLSLKTIYQDMVTSSLEDEQPFNVYEKFECQLITEFQHIKLAKNKNVNFIIGYARYNKTFTFFNKQQTNFTQNIALLGVELKYYYKKNTTKKVRVFARTGAALSFDFKNKNLANYLKGKEQNFVPAFYISLLNLELKFWKNYYFNIGSGLGYRGLLNISIVNKGLYK